LKKRFGKVEISRCIYGSGGKDGNYLIKEKETPGLGDSKRTKRSANDRLSTKVK